MSILTGITNANEFYSNHYLDAILKDDIKGVATGWKERESREEEEYKAPPRQLAALSAVYFRLRERFRRQRSAADRLAVQREWLGMLLPVLGYELNPELLELEEGERLPAIAQQQKSNGMPLLWVLEALPEGDESADVLSLGFDSVQLLSVSDSESEELSDESIPPCTRPLFLNAPQGYKPPILVVAVEIER